MAKSPISNKVHVASREHVIPIPLALQLPPKLSPSLSRFPDRTKRAPAPNLRLLASPTSPQLKSSPTMPTKTPLSPLRLIFTGSTYEVESSESEHNESLVLEDDSFRQKKPPSVTSSRRKVAKFVRKTHLVPVDQLSMIDESLTRAPSRAVLKDLPAPPPQNLPPHEFIRDSKLATIYSECGKSAPPSNLENVLATQALMKIRAESQIQPEQSDTAEKIGRLLGETNSGQSATSTSVSSATLANSDSLRPRTSMVGPTATARLPHSQPFHHDLHLGLEDHLCIGKRTFSDESHVSSVSLFSSVGDFLVTRAGVASPAQPRDNRIASHIDRYLLTVSSKQGSVRSQKSGTSVFSWGQSINLSGNEDGDHLIDEDSYEEASGVLAQADQLFEPPGEDNNGAGKSFDFPNDNRNVTNSKEARERASALASRLRLSNSHYSVMAPNGQIEIPDLDALDLKRYSSNAKSDSTIEPLGVPTRDARAHVRKMYGESLDSDSDALFNSQFHKLNTQPAESKDSANSEKTSSLHVSQTKHSQSSAPVPAINMVPAAPSPFGSFSSVPVSKSVGNDLARSTNLSAKSPVRHSRHRSMCNIDFSADTPGPSTHARSRSTYDFVKESFEADLKSQNVKNKPTVTSLPRDSLHNDLDFALIKVAEPPKKVEYAVDFKEKSSGDILSTANSPYYKNGGASECSSTYRTAASDLLSYFSGNSGKETASTAPTDNNDSDSVVIDLTSEKYNVCMIKRNDTTLSYRSVIEKTKEGKEVEVILVEEDEQANLTHQDADFDDSRDDLLEIYSQYRSSWVDRSNSVRSTTSTASNASSTASWNMGSESTFNVKHTISNRLNLSPRKPIQPIQPLRSLLRQQRIQSYKQTPKSNRLQSMPLPETKEATYFDYSTGDNYNFSTFMKLRAG